MGIIYVVKTTWLEDCDREKKEVPVLKRHIAQDLLLPKGPLLSYAFVYIYRLRLLSPTFVQTGEIF